MTVFTYIFQLLRQLYNSMLSFIICLLFCDCSSCLDTGKSSQLHPFFYAFSNRYENYKAYKLPLHSLQSDEQLLRCLLVKIQAELIRKMQKITYSSNSLLSASLCLKSSSSSSVRNSSFFRVLKRRWSIPWSILWETNRPPKCTYF